MEFKTSINKSRTIKIDNKDYTISPISVSDLNDACELIYRREKEIDKDAKRMSLYDTAINLIFNNPQLALYVALSKCDKEITFDIVNSMNLVGNDEAVELVSWLVGVELQKKT